MSAGQSDAEDSACLGGIHLAGRTLEPLLADALALTAGYCGLLADDPALPEDARAYAREALQGVERAMALVRRLRDLRSIELVEGGAAQGPVLRLEAEPS